MRNSKTPYVTVLVEKTFARRIFYGMQILKSFSGKKRHKDWPAGDYYGIK